MCNALFCRKQVEEVETLHKNWRAELPMKGYGKRPFLDRVQMVKPSLQPMCGE